MTLDKSSSIDMWHYEKLAMSQGYTCICGIDEAGRGPLAGPVTAACVALPLDFEHGFITDSKKLTEKRREEAYEIICRHAISIGIGIVHSDIIDKINILKATHRAMQLAICNMEPVCTPTFALVDGLPVKGLPCLSQAIVSGDSLSVSIASASIIAKVTRDRMMHFLDNKYPEYHFKKHKGYGTKIHLDALRDYGPTPLHRRSFAPVMECCAPTLWDD